MATGYAGGDYYIDERAVVDGDLITAGPQSPVQFASATLRHLGLASARTLEAYERAFHGADATAFPCSCRLSTRHDHCSGREGRDCSTA